MVNEFTCMIQKYLANQIVLLFVFFFSFLLLLLFSFLLYFLKITEIPYTFENWLNKVHSWQTNYGGIYTSINQYRWIKFRKGSNKLFKPNKIIH